MGRPLTTPKPSSDNQEDSYLCRKPHLWFLGETLLWSTWKKGVVGVLSWVNGVRTHGTCISPPEMYIFLFHTELCIGALFIFEEAHILSWALLVYVSLSFLSSHCPSSQYFQIKPVFILHCCHPLIFFFFNEGSQWTWKIWVRSRTDFIYFERLTKQDLPNSFFWVVEVEKEKEVDFLLGATIFFLSTSHNSPWRPHWHLFEIMRQ